METGVKPKRTGRLQTILRERRWAWSIAGLTMLLTLVPYLIGAYLADGRVFMWLGYNLDDSCVYLSWMRQAAEGSYRALNLFTTDPQKGMALNPLFLVLGRFAGVTGLPLLAVYQGARMILGLGLLALVWEFIRLLVADSRARKLAFLFVCFSAGLGWLPNWWDVNSLMTPVDRWQPEAITFLSLYLSPLFIFSLGLQVGLIALLYRGAQTGLARYALAAGICGFVLGLVHSYDIITMSAIWSAYLLVQTVVLLRGSDPLPSNLPIMGESTLPQPANTEGREAHQRVPILPNPERSGGRSLVAMWLQAILAGAITFPAVLYIYLELNSEKVFRERANVPTLSSPLIWVLLGYGLTLVLAVVGVIAFYRKSQSASPQLSNDGGRPEGNETGSYQTWGVRGTQDWVTSADAGRLLIVWAIVNIAISYLPHTPFQRKMLQGAHFPIAILAGIGAAMLLQPVASALRRIWPRYAAFVLALVIFFLTLILSLTNIFFVLRDIVNYTVNRAQTGTHRTYLQPGEIQALEWLTAHTPSTAAVQPLPWVQSVSEHQFAAYDMALPCFTPGLTGRHVYCGHWGETPDYGAKLHELSRFGLPSMTDDARIALLKKMQVRYIIFSQKAPSDPSADALMPMFRGQATLPSYLTHVYPDPSRGEINTDADIYEVSPSVLASSP